MKTFKLPIVLAMALVVFGAPDAGQAAATPNKQAKAVEEAKPYPLKGCVVSGNTLKDGEGTLVLEYRGQEIKLCGEECRKAFTKKPSKYMAKVKKANRQVKRYLLDTCAVSGKKLGDRPRRIVHRGQELKFCSSACRETFLDEQRTATAKAD